MARLRLGNLWTEGITHGRVTFVSTLPLSLRPTRRSEERARRGFIIIITHMGKEIMRDYG